MANLFLSEHLMYRGLDLQTDVEFLSTIRQDPIAFLQADDKLLVPQTREDIIALIDWFATTSLMAVIICLPPAQLSANPVPIGWIRLKCEGANFRHHRRSEIGISLAEPYRNQGHGSEAIRWILD